MSDRKCNGRLGHRTPTECNGRWYLSLDFKHAFNAKSDSALQDHVTGYTVTQKFEKFEGMRPKCKTQARVAEPKIRWISEFHKTLHCDIMTNEKSNIID